VKNILVSGTNGYIGSWIFDLLIRNNNVISLNRDCTCKSSDYSRFITYDAFDELSDTELASFFKNFDIFIHVASEIDFSPLNTQLTYFNIYKFHSILTRLKSIGFQKVILISSAALVSSAGANNSSEEIQVKAPSLYHFTKYSQEQILNFLSFDFFYSLRVSSPVGPGLKRKSIFSVLINQALNGDEIKLFGKGTREQNYIDVRDIAELCFSLVYYNLPSGVYNICAPHSISNYNLAKKIIQLSSSQSKIRYFYEDSEEGIIWNFDSSKALLNLGFRCRYSIDDSILDYIKHLNS